MKRWILLGAAWLAATLGLSAQENILDRAFGTALTAYEDGRYGTCVELVDEVIREGGESPRAESLRALALHELGRPEEAFRSLERYAELTRGLPGLGENKAHLELLRLLEEYRTRLETEKKEKERKLQEERDREAAQATATAREEIRGKRAGLVRSADAVLAKIPPDRLAGITEADVARLKAAGLNAFVARFDPRLFAIPRLDTGVFKLGMTRDEFEKVVDRRLRAFRTEDGVLRDVANTYRPATGGAAVWLGSALPVKVGAHDEEWVQVSALQIHALTRPGYDRNRHDGPLREMLQAMTASGSPALAGLGGVDAPAQLTDVRFDRKNRIDQLTFAAILPPSVTDPSAVVRVLQQRFGPIQPNPSAASDGIKKPNGTFADKHALVFEFPPVAGLVLEARVAQVVEPILRSPWVLELRLTRLPPEGEPRGSKRLTAIVPFEQRGLFTELRNTQRMNAWLQSVNGQTVLREGRPAALVIGPEAFMAQSDWFAFGYGFRDPADGKVETIQWMEIPTAQIESIAKRRLDPHSPHGATVYEIHLLKPVQFSPIVEGVATKLVNTTIVPVYGGYDETVLLEAIALALPKLDTLDAAAVGRLGRLLWSYSPTLDAIVTPFLRAADEQGKLPDPRLLVDRYAGRDEAQWLKYLRRSATAGNRDSAWELIKHFEPIWRNGKGSAAVAARAELLAWAQRGAEAGDPNAMRKLVEVFAHEDYVSADPWVRKLASLGEKMPLGLDDSDAAKISRRAAQVRRLSGLDPETRVKAYVPDLAKSALGQKFKQYAKPEMQWAKKEEYPSLTSGRRVTVYQRGEKITSGPQLVWVNRKGVIIGEHYLLGGSSVFVSEFQHEAAGLRQVFGDQVVAMATDGTNIREGLTVRNASAKTIELLRYKEKASYLKVIDHAQE